MKKLENVEILYHSDYWDVPLKGMCSYKNKFYWYEVINSTSEIIKFKVIKIETWQIAYELYWHCLFVNNVIIAFTEFDKGLINNRFERLENIYSMQKRQYKKIDYSKNKVIGYFNYKE